MVRRVVIALAVLASACGRLGFDPFEDGTVDPDAIGDPPGCTFTFCDDFDRDPPIEMGWTALFNSGGAALALAQNMYLLSLPAPQLESGFLEKTFPRTTTRVKLWFSMKYLSNDPSTAEIDLVQLKWDTLPAMCTSFGYYLVRDGTGPLGLQETYGGCGGNENTALGNRDNTGPHDIFMMVTFGPIGTARIRVDVDGATLVEKGTSHAIDPSTLTLRVGGGAVRDMAAPWQIQFDDLYVQLD